MSVRQKTDEYQPFREFEDPPLIKRAKEKLEHILFYDGPAILGSLAVAGAGLALAIQTRLPQAVMESAAEGVNSLKESWQALSAGRG